MKNHIDKRFGKPPFKQLKYCLRCCMPETRAHFVLDEMGICDACNAHEQKMHINWAERKKKLETILETAKKRNDNYHCIVPISGGKDSTWQLHVLVNVYHMKVLAVTFNHNWYSKTGKYNLENALEKFNVDHIMFTPNRALVNKLAKHSLFKMGDPCWHCHAGVGSFPIWVAVKFNIPLLVWGEPAAEYQGTYFEPIAEYDRDYYTKTSAKLYAEEMTGDGITMQDLCMFKLPTLEEFEKAKVQGIHLGDFMFWDDERQTEFVIRKYGWRETEIEGTYKKYKSAECTMTGAHDYSRTVKKGHGRATDHASQDVRAGLLTREEGFEIAKKIDFKVPKILKKYYKESNLAEEDFYNACRMNRDGVGKELP